VVNTKLSELEVDVPKKQAISNNKIISYVGKAKGYEWLYKNVEDLVTAVDQYLRTYNNLTRKIKAGGLVERRNKRMVKMLEYLKKLEEKKRE